MIMTTKIGQIPDGYIEDADNYAIIPMDTQRTIELGGRIMFKSVVLDQMTLDNIVLTSGLKKKVCCIVVSYTAREVIEMIGNAKRMLGKFIDEGGDLYGKKIN